MMVVMIKLKKKHLKDQLEKIYMYVHENCLNFKLMNF